MDNKTGLRIRAKSIRKTLDIAKLSRSAVQQIRNLELYKSAKNVLIFYPMKYEINFLELLNDDKNFYLPKVCGDELLVCPFTQELVKSDFNICEPCSKPVEPDMIELAIVPALMADKEGYRLGYGGGFYDRFLAANPHIKTVTAAAKELFTEALPHENFDVQIGHVIIV